MPSSDSFAISINPSPLRFAHIPGLDVLREDIPDDWIAVDVLVHALEMLVVFWLLVPDEAPVVVEDASDGAAAQDAPAANTPPPRRLPLFISGETHLLPIREKPRQPLVLRDNLEPLPFLIPFFFNGSLPRPLDILIHLKRDYDKDLNTVIPPPHQLSTGPRFPFLSYFRTVPFSIL